MHWLIYLFIIALAVSIFTWLPTAQNELLTSGPAGTYALYFGNGVLVLLGLTSWLYLYEHIMLRSSERLTLVLAGFVIVIPLIHQVSVTVHLPTHVDIVRNLQNYDSALADELEPGYLMIEGVIGPLTLPSIKSYASDHELYGIFLESHGGLINHAIDIADYVQRNSLNTYVINSCESACVIIAVSGNQLYASPDAQFGFHRAAAATTSEGEYAQAISVDGTVKMREVLSYYGVPADILSLMNQTDNDKMTYFSGVQLYHLGLVGKLLD